MSSLKYNINDIEINLDSVYISQTYAGYLFGRIQAANRELVREHKGESFDFAENVGFDNTRIQHGKTELWGERPTTIVYPEGWNEEMELPDTKWIAWLDSEWTSEQYQHGSQLFLVGFCDSPLDVFDSIKETLVIIDWKQESDDFEY